jgi:glyoxylase-like metal-dependent hydrolase (beta-lactamase superfamily II)
MKHLTLSKILLTHGHFDHMNGASAVAKETGAEIFIHEDDAYMLENASASLSSSMSIMEFNPIKQFTAITDGCLINDGDVTFRVLHTPGHSRGSVCYICNDVIFTGDTLFCCSIGRTDFPGSDADSMHSSLIKLRDLDGDYRIYPGHDESSTLSYERETNPYMIRL